MPQWRVARLMLPLPCKSQRGARAVLPRLAETQTRLGEWLRDLLARAHRNTVIVALAAKLARIAWAVLARGGSYEAAMAAS